MSTLPPSPAPSPTSGWQRFASGAVRLFHDYANWLVSISWKRFFVLSVLLLIVTSVLQKLPPFRFGWTEEIQVPNIKIPDLPKVPPIPPVPPIPSIKIEKPSKGDSGDVSISIDKNGIRIGPRNAGTPAAAASAASAAASAASAALGAATAGSESPKAATEPGDGSITITLPGATRDQIREAARAAREAAREARDQAREAADESRQQAEEARRDAEEARRDAEQAVEEAKRDIAEAVADANRATKQYSRRIVHYGDSLTDLAFLWIIASAILKISYKGRVQAEVKAAAGDRDSRVGAAQAPGRRGAHGGDAGAGRAALPVQHAGEHRPPDRDRPAAREPDAEEPDRAAARLDADDARGHADGRATSGARWR